jgi:hypothetical protein
MPSEAPVTDFPINDAASESSGSPTAARKKPKKIIQEDQGTLQKVPQQQLVHQDNEDDFDDAPEPRVMPRRAGGRRMVPVHQSRIADRPAKVGEKDSSLKIKIELDLEVEVEIYARVKGDVTIGLM